MIGKTISHYTITEKLGEGGMGEVYLADDLKLERQVAIKFLPEHLTKDKENVERFKREAKAAAALNHPNIVTIYEIAEEDDPATADKQTFIVMEYVDGESLRTKIDTGISDLDELLDITKQTCEGLSEAHKADIVHRDIKPENILIDSHGRVKILDFGLAKLKGVSRLTKESSTLGTIHYMSPEQIQGKEVDQRSDIWSLGVLIYEMLTGEPPFKGEYEQAVSYAILNEEPKLLKDIEIKYSPEICELIKRMIAKDVKERYQNCGNVLNDLNKYEGTKPKKRKPMSKRAYIFSGIAATITLILLFVLFFLPREEDEKSIISLAVLPFTNIKPDPNIDYLGNALAAEIISDLSYFKNISVRPFSTVRDLENLDNLDVDYILTGNFLRVMGDIRLKIELFNTNTNNILWQESLEAEFKKSYKLQDIVSKKVIDELKIQFSSDEQDHMRVDLPRNPQAYEYYLRSLSYSSETNDDSLAIDILKKSIQLDSSYAPAYDELAFRTMRFRQGAFKVASEYGQAEQYFLKALSINNGLITSLNNLSGIYTEIGETEKSMDLVKKALDINPNNAYTHFQLSYNYRYAGMLAESKEEAEIALKIDPNNQRFRSIGNTYLYLREYGKALETYDLDENSVYVLCKKGATFLRNGQRDKALHYFKRAIERNPEGQWGLSSSTAKAYIEGNIKKGLKTNFRWEQAEPFDSESLYNIASNYGLLGEATGCVRMLRKAIEGGFFCYPFLLTDPFLDPVRDDPEFQEVLALAKEKHEAFKKKYFPEEL